MPTLSMRVMLCLACAFAAIPATAADIGVSPTRLVLTPAQRVGTVTLRNNDAGTLDFQVSLKRWSMQDGGAWLLEDAGADDGLTAYPLAFRVAPGKTQVVRVGIPRTLQVGDERAFRLLVLELPRERPPGTVTGPQLLNQFSLPVFVNDGDAVPSLELMEGRIDGRIWRVALRLAGDGHLDPGHALLRVYDGAGAQLAGIPLKLPYVLRGAVVELEVPLGEACAAATRYAIEGGPLDGRQGSLPSGQQRRCGG